MIELQESGIIATTLHTTTTIPDDDVYLDPLGDVSGMLDTVNQLKTILD